MSYSWNDNKNKTAESISGTMHDYGFSIPTGGYDDEDRLVSYNRTDGNLDQTWSLSDVGDWDSVTTEGSTQNRTHGASHELTVGGGQNVTTDVKGNITLIPSVLRSNSSSLLLNWDIDNRLSTADVGNNSSVDVTYKFDALGRRVYRDDGTTAMVYVQSGQQTIADYVAGTSAGSPTCRYVYASYIDEPVLRYKPSGSESLYYHRNQQYSVTALTDGSGAIVERYAYSAYGEPTITNISGTLRSVSSYDNRYTYTGREWDPTIFIYHYRARMYDSSLGRFCSKDPIGYHGSRFNVFAYVSGRPLVKTDSSGKHDDTITYPLPPRDCSKSDEDSVLGDCWLVCGLCGNMPWRSNPTGAIYQEALEWAGTIVPPNEGDPNPIGNQALRHCFASAMMTCEFRGPCASCLMNQREIYQLQCSGQTDRDANRAINNNNIGVSIGHGTCDKDEQKRKCLQAFRDGELDTRPDAPDGPHVHPTDPDIDFAD